VREVDEIVRGGEETENIPPATRRGPKTVMRVLDKENHREYAASPLGKKGRRGSVGWN